jgi:hypothetical protein
MGEKECQFRFLALDISVSDRSFLIPRRLRGAFLLGEKETLEEGIDMGANSEGEHVQSDLLL